MSYMQCQKCGGMFGVIGRVVYTCGCVPPIPVPVTEVIEETIVTGPQPGLGSGALREALEQIASITCSCHDSADANWHGKRCPKGIALAALSLSSPIEPPQHDLRKCLRDLSEVWQAVKGDSPAEKCMRSCGATLEDVLETHRSPGAL